MRKIILVLSFVFLFFGTAEAGKYFGAFGTSTEVDDTCRLCFSTFDTLGHSAEPLGDSCYGLRFVRGTLVDSTAGTKLRNYEWCITKKAYNGTYLGQYTILFYWRPCAGKWYNDDGYYVVEPETVSYTRGDTAQRNVSVLTTSDNIGINADDISGDFDSTLFGAQYKKMILNQVNARSAIGDTSKKQNDPDLYKATDFATSDSLKIAQDSMNQNLSLCYTAQDSLNIITGLLKNGTYGLSALESLVDDLESRLTSGRAGFLDNLNHPLPDSAKIEDSLQIVLDFLYPLAESLNVQLFLASTAQESLDVILSLVYVIPESVWTYEYRSLRESANKNLLNYSEEFDNAVWVTTNAEVHADQGKAPDSTNTADVLLATDDPSYIAQQTGLMPSRSVGNFTFSVWAKANEPHDAKIYVLDDQSWGGATNIFRCSTVWVRQSVSHTFDADGDTGRIICRIAPDILPGVQDSIYIWGAQVEIFPHPSTYVERPAEALAVDSVRKVYLVDTLDQAVSAEVDSEEISRAVWDDDILPLENRTVNASCAGAGENTLLIYVKDDSDSSVLDGFLVQIEDSATGSPLIWGHTNSAGVCTFAVDDGHYAIYLRAPRWTITSPVYKTITDNTILTYYATGISPSPPPVDSVCVVNGFVKHKDGSVYVGAKVEIWMDRSGVSYHDVLIDVQTPSVAYTDTAGYFEFSNGIYPNDLLLPANTKWWIKVSTKTGFVIFKEQREVPVADSYELEIVID